MWVRIDVFFVSVLLLTVRPNVDRKQCKIPFVEGGSQYYCLLRGKVMQCRASDSNNWINCRDGKIRVKLVLSNGIVAICVWIGGFVQIESGQFDVVGERSQFDSPVLDALSEEGCVQFHYNIAGTDNDRLNVYVRDYWTGNESCVWHKNGSTSPNRWIAAEAPLTVEKDGKYQVCIRLKSWIESVNCVVEYRRSYLKHERAKRMELV